MIQSITNNNQTSPTVAHPGSATNQMQFSVINPYNLKTYDVTISNPLNIHSSVDSKRYSGVYTSIKKNIQSIANDIFANSEFRNAKRVDTTLLKQDYFTIKGTTEEDLQKTLQVTKSSHQKLYDELDSLRTLFSENNSLTSPLPGVTPTVAQPKTSSVRVYPEKNLSTSSTNSSLNLKKLPNLPRVPITLTSDLSDQNKSEKKPVRKALTAPSPTYISIPSNDDVSNFSFNKKLEYFKNLEKKNEISLPSKTEPDPQIERILPINFGTLTMQRVDSFKKPILQDTTSPLLQEDLVDLGVYKKHGTELPVDIGPLYPLNGYHSKIYHSTTPLSDYHALSKDEIAKDFKLRLVMINGEWRGLMLTDEQYESQPLRRPNYCDLFMID